MDLLDNYYNNIQILENLYTPYNGYEFYKYIFPNNENKGELSTDYSKPNAIFLYEKRSSDNDTKYKFRRRIMLNDTWQDDYLHFVEMNNITLCSGLSYIDKINKLSNARQMNALIFDIDNVGVDELNNLLLKFQQPSDVDKSIPIPTFIALSGTGVHLYYVFDEPIILYPYTKIQLKNLKYELTFRIWEYNKTSKEEEIQFQSINQCFRMVGSLNDKYNVEVVAFKVGDKVTIDYLNTYIEKSKNKVDINEIFKTSTMTLREAAEKYPHWYEKVVVNNNRKRKKWDIKSKQKYALYEWWISQSDNIKGGHRYFYMMCMAVYASKCDVPKSKLENDMYDIFDKLQSINHTNPLSKNDILSALEMYSKEYYNLTISVISKLTNVKIERNKRNFRKQKEHISYMNDIKNIKSSNNECTKGGRPSAENIVYEWKLSNENGTKANCIRETGLSKKTVYKWWNQ